MPGRFHSRCGADGARTALARHRRARRPADRRGGSSYGAGFAGVGVLETESPDSPENETALDFVPGPDGLDTKRVVMPRLQRTDLLRPAIGGAAAANKLVEPEYDRFRNYFGAAGLRRVREARREQGNHRIRAIFMIVMVLTLGFILFKMIT